jgi:hypothetical protein
MAAAEHDLDQDMQQGGLLMNARQSTHMRQISAIWISVGLALFTALAYLLIAWKMLGVGDLNMTEAPPAIVYVAAGCYLLGGFLILLRNRALLISGAVINAMVVLFFSIYIRTVRPLCSPPVA